MKVLAEQISDGSIAVRTDRLEARITPNGYVSGVAGGSLRDLETGAHDLGFGLDIVDFLMEPGWGKGRWHEEHLYERNIMLHGRIPKRYVELPQICTQAKKISVEYAVGAEHVLVRQWWCFTEAAPGYRAGSLWEQTLVFPSGKRFFLACDKITSVNTVEELFLRIDMPGHLKHERADTFEEVYLSYHGRIPSSSFLNDFPPDERYLYQRGSSKIPKSLIRAYKIRSGPWLAGITLDPKMVSESWCHQRGYVCFIEEIGRLPLRVGDSFSAAYLVGFFDDIDEMTQVSRQYKGYTSLAGDVDWWCLSEGVLTPEDEGKKKGALWYIKPQGLWKHPPSGTWHARLHGKGVFLLNGTRFSFDGVRDIEVPNV